MNGYVDLSNAMGDDDCDDSAYEDEIIVGETIIQEDNEITSPGDEIIGSTEGVE